MFQIDIDSQAVLTALARLQQATNNMSPVMANIAQALASESERQFQTETGPGGNWPDLSDTTKMFRERMGKWPGKKLQLSGGGLAASVQTGYDDNTAWIGSNKPYAAMHQFGGKTSPRSMIPNKTIQARPYLPFDATGALTDNAQHTILEILQAHLESAING